MPETTAVPCVGAVVTAMLAVPFSIVSLLVTASVVAVFQGTVAESFTAVACAAGESLLPPQAVRAARAAAPMAVGIHRFEIWINSSSELRSGRSRQAPVSWSQFRSLGNIR